MRCQDMKTEGHEKKEEEKKYVKGKEDEKQNQMEGPKTNETKPGLVNIVHDVCAPKTPADFNGS